MEARGDSYKVISDITEEYSKMIIASLQIIRELQYVIIEEPRKIQIINLELDEIFKKVQPLMEMNELKKEIREYKLLSEKMNRLQPLKKDRRPNEDGEVRSVYKPSTDFNRYRQALQDKETRIYSAMVRTGIIKIKKEKAVIR